MKKQLFFMLFKKQVTIIYKKKNEKVGSIKWNQSICFFPIDSCNPSVKLYMCCRACTKSTMEPKDKIDQICTNSAKKVVFFFTFAVKIILVTQKIANKIMK